MARIEVRFLIDANGILNVTARDARTDVEQSMDVKPSYGLTDEQVEAMIEASIDHAEEDFRAAQLVEAKAGAEAILKATAKAKTNIAWGVLPAEEKHQIDGTIAALEAAMLGTDPHAITTQTDALNAATQHLAETIMNSALKGMLKGTKPSIRPGTGTTVSTNHCSRAFPLLLSIQIRISGEILHEKQTEYAHTGTPLNSSRLLKSCLSG